MDTRMAGARWRLARVAREARDNGARFFCIIFPAFLHARVYPSLSPSLNTTNPFSLFCSSRTSLLLSTVSRSTHLSRVYGALRVAHHAHQRRYLAPAKTLSTSPSSLNKLSATKASDHLILTVCLDADNYAVGMVEKMKCVASSGDRLTSEIEAV
jgi:hypothetical protein